MTDLERLRAIIEARKAELKHRPYVSHVNAYRDVDVLESDYVFLLGRAGAAERAEGALEKITEAMTNESVVPDMCGFRCLSNEERLDTIAAALKDWREGEGDD